MTEADYAQADLADDLLDPDNLHTGTVVPLITAMAKLSANESQLSHSMNVGEFTLDIRNGFSGWTLAELSVLNRYRRRAM